MDANRLESEAGPQFQDVLPNRSIRVHGRPFAVDLNSYGADGSLKNQIASQIFSRQERPFERNSEKINRRKQRKRRKKF